MTTSLRPILFIALFLTASGTAFSQSARTTAKTNDEVWVVAYPVKAGKQAQYERFVHDIFWVGAKKLSPAEQKIFRQTRILHPTKADADGTYPYLFIMDPVIKGADYNIESLIKKMYGSAKGAEYFKLFSDAVAGKTYREYVVRQSKD